MVGAAGLGGVYSLAQAEETARLSAVTRLAHDDIEARLGVVSNSIQSLADRDAFGGSRKDVARVLELASVRNAEFVDVIVVTDASGRRLLSSPHGKGPSRLDIPSTLDGDRPSFAWVPAKKGAPGGAMWVYAPAHADKGRTVVAGRVRTGFIQRLIGEGTLLSGERRALLVDRDGAVVSLGPETPAAEVALELTPEQRGVRAGSVTGEVTGLGGVTGYYSDIDEAPELGWRLVVLASTNSVMPMVWRALFPATSIALLSLVLAVGATFLWSRRIVSPLRLLERRAKEVASGGYVRQVSVEGDDELGRFAVAFNKMAVRLNSLQDMAHLLAGGSDLDEVLESVLTASGHMLGTGDTAVMLVDEERRGVSLARGHGLRDAGVTYWVPMESASPVSAAIVERQVIRMVAPEETWAKGLYGLFDAETDRQGVVVPLVVGEEALGAIVVIAPGAKPFTDAQLDTLRAFSANAAVAVHNSRLFMHEHVSRTEAESLRDAAEYIAGSSALSEVLERAGAIACELSGMSGYAIAIADRPSVGLGESDDSRERKLLELWVAASSAGRTAAGTSDPIEVPDVDADPRVRELIGPGPARALLVPLLKGDQAAGALTLFSDRLGEPISARQIALAGTIGRQLSLALENASLLQQARARAANLETVFRISQAVSSSLQLGVVLNRVLDVVQKIFTADAVSLMAYDAAKRTITTSMARGISNREMLYLQVGPGEDIPGKVYAEGAAAAFARLEVVDTPLARLAVAQGLHSMLAVPLLARGRSIGVLTVMAREESAYTSEDMELLLTFAAQAALAIDTAGLYGREHHVASVLQSSILPERLPEIEGLAADAFYLPVGTEAEIGGDFYDLFPLRDGRVVVAIGDVCGKGVLAATKTSMIRYSLRGMVAAGMGPAATLSELNRLVAATGDPGDIVTAWLGVVDLGRGALAFANGGHPPAMLSHSDGRIRALEPTGPLLGALATSEYAELEVPFEAGDLLLAYTDGVTEARRGDQFFGEERVRAVIQRSASAAEVVAGLMEDLSTFSAGMMRDDAAALAIGALGDADDPAARVRAPGKHGRVGGRRKG